MIILRDFVVSPVSRHFWKRLEGRPRISEPGPAGCIVWGVGEGDNVGELWVDTGCCSAGSNVVGGLGHWWL